MKTSKEPMDLSLFPCQHLKGVGKKINEKLTHLGIHTIQDLLFHLPMRYQDRTRVYRIAQLIPGEYGVIEGQIETITKPKIGRTRLLCRLYDMSGRMTLRFFHANAFQLQQIKEGMRLRCFGEVRRGMHGLEMIHPEWRIVDDSVVIPSEVNLTPIYPTTAGLSQLMWRKLTEQALQLLLAGGVLQDILPLKLLHDLTFPTLAEAIHFVHRPPPDAPIEILLAGKHRTQKRLVFEELLAHRLSLLHLKNKFQLQKAIPQLKSATLLEKFLQSLTFNLTQAQKKVSAEISHDLMQTHPMLRLVQGDVGSGKTVIAALAVLQTLANNCQCALLAPTELLAEQHFHTFQKWFAPLKINVVLLSGKLPVAERRQALAALADGTAAVTIGTHAIFQKSVSFKKLALIIVDEQHRFGVEQRALLREKGLTDSLCPHQLILSATPIPRTLAMSVYADLDYSIIDELPPGRIPVITTVVPNSRREEVLLRIQESCRQGRQAYWVCTLIAESELLECQAAEKTAAELQMSLTHVSVGLIHGRMKPAEKNAVMVNFKSGNIQLLVATTVIEVGVDVPNASLMVIENAERLGLAQLHQLRGRVGRGSIASHCVLMYQGPLSKLAQERLQVMRETNDGFKIAQRDLELRGPGEVLGTRQTGEMQLRIADLLRDSDLLPVVHQAASLLQTKHKELINPLVKRWVGNKAEFGNV